MTARIISLEYRRRILSVRDSYFSTAVQYHVAAELTCQFIVWKRRFPTLEEVLTDIQGPTTPRVRVRRRSRYVLFLGSCLSPHEFVVVVLPFHRRDASIGHHTPFDNSVHLLLSTSNDADNHRHWVRVPSKISSTERSSHHITEPV